MRMRARKYSVLNRSIARSITYALRDNNRKKYRPNTYNNKKETNNIDNGEGLAVFIFIAIIIIVVAAITH